MRSRCCYLLLAEEMRGMVTRLVISSDSVTLTLPWNSEELKMSINTTKGVDLF